MAVGARRRWSVLVTILLVLAAGILAADRLMRHGSSASGTRGAAAAITLQPVLRRSLTQRTQVTGTLGYAGHYTIRGRDQGTLTWLPSIGQVIEQGQRLYERDATPTVLLYGTIPAYRGLADSGTTTGSDVAQLNHDLVALGYLNRAEADQAWSRFTAATSAAVKRMQHHLGVPRTGRLPLGSVVFLPTAARVTTLLGGLGAPAAGAIMTATSTVPTVTVALDAGLQTEVKTGNKVSISLPDTRTTTGTITSVGQVATVAADGQDGADNATATVPVTIRLIAPAAAGHWDQAPVLVAITTSTVANVLAVPVNALLALAGDRYAVEVVDRGGTHRLVPVTPGLFDDVSGLVQVTAVGLGPGQQVAVPAS
jgi:hypothetical protein